MNTKATRFYNTQYSAERVARAVVRASRRRRREVVLTAAGVAAVAMSTVQLVVGDALLPRFVVFGSVLVLVPWFMLCVNVAADGRALDERRDRVLVVADRAEATYLTDELERVPEVAARVVAHLSPAAAGALAKDFEGEGLVSWFDGELAKAR